MRMPYGSCGSSSLEAVPELRRGHEWSTQQACREPMAGFGHIFRTDYLIFRRRHTDASESTAHSERPCRVALVRCDRRFGGAVQVYAGLRLSIKQVPGFCRPYRYHRAHHVLLDHCGWFRMQPRLLNAGRIIGGVLIAGGVSLIASSEQAPQRWIPFTTPTPWPLSDPLQDRLSHIGVCHQVSCCFASEE